jgi:hypothetical protein
LARYWAGGESIRANQGIFRPFASAKGAHFRATVFTCGVPTGIVPPLELRPVRS